MLIPYNIVVLLILSPFILILWVVKMIAKELLRIALWMAKGIVKLLFKALSLLFREVRRILTA